MSIYRPHPLSNSWATAHVPGADESFKTPVGALDDHPRYRSKLGHYQVLYPLTKAKTYEEATHQLRLGSPMLVGRRYGSAVPYVTIGDLPAGLIIVLAYSDDHKQRTYRV